jgi:hypothetical protein
MKTIAITCFVGWVVRNLGHTNLIDELARNYKIVIICDSKLFPQVEAMARDNPNIDIKQVTVKTSSAARKLKSLLSLITSVQYFPMYASYKYNKFLRSAAVLGSLDLIESSAQRLYMRLCDDKHLAHQLSEGLDAIDELLITSPFGIEDHHIQENISGNPSVAHYYLSWDNIYTKGYSFKADKYLVWADFMKEAVVNVKGCLTDAVYAVETPFIGGIGRCSGPQRKRNLLYSCTTAMHYPDEINLIKILKTCFIADWSHYFDNFIIRTHPAGPNFVYNSLEDKAQHVVVSHPTKVEEKSLYDWVPDSGELVGLYQALTDADIVINVASTMSIDAASHNALVINVGFHNIPSVDARVKKYYKFEHYRNLVDLDLVKIALNENDLKLFVNKGIEDGKSRSTLSVFDNIFDNRKHSFVKFIGALDA